MKTWPSWLSTKHERKRLRALGRTAQQVEMQWVRHTILHLNFYNTNSQNIILIHILSHTHTWTHFSFVCTVCVCRDLKLSLPGLHLTLLKQALSVNTAHWTANKAIPCSCKPLHLWRPWITARPPHLHSISRGEFRPLHLQVDRIYSLVYPLYTHTPN